ncbi:hypothetical protein [Cohaesibacter celericrescens]|uniref:Uncharacterized protein n=1 Tax=Cohaesibacter celericrescens TaxID=2067669 RepID=A0A2N5XX25_9HYPH|nr:hypothetical protein [Cohaesibacter celericrescens]PLW79007.1 hypothetical protein C0081_01870 [Cohaesibacter celericrescens]
MKFTKQAILTWIATSTLCMTLPVSTNAAGIQAGVSSKDEWCGPCKMVDGTNQTDPIVEEKVRRRKAKKIVILPDPRARSTDLKIESTRGKNN